MCLESSKQEYVILSAFSKAGAEGLTFPNSIKSMTEISNDVFGTSAYAFAPFALIPTLRELVDANALSADEGVFRITESGEKELDSVRTTQVRPKFVAA